ncbi:MAG: response regulator transcription factor [Pseudomonadota bacterium]
MAIRLLLVDDHVLMCRGLKSMLSDQADVQVVGEAHQGRQAVLLARQLLPDLVLMDVTMPDLNGMEATRQIKVEAPGVKVMALSMHREDRFVLGMLRAGATGYMIKDCDFSDLMGAIRTVAGGRTYLSPEVSDLVVKGFLSALDHLPPANPSDSLSPREREVVQMLAEGASAKLVAERLHLSIKTVEAHRRNAMEKLNLSSLAELIKFALREGITSLET